MSHHALKCCSHWRAAVAPGTKNCSYLDLMRLWFPTFVSCQSKSNQCALCCCCSWTVFSIVYTYLFSLPLNGHTWTHTLHSVIGLWTLGCECLHLSFSHSSYFLNFFQLMMKSHKLKKITSLSFFLFLSVCLISFLNNLSFLPRFLLTISSLGPGRLTVSAVSSILGKWNQGLYFGSASHHSAPSTPPFHQRPLCLHNCCPSGQPEVT